MWTSQWRRRKRIRLKLVNMLASIKPTSLAMKKTSLVSRSSLLGCVAILAQTLCLWEMLPTPWTPFRSLNLRRLLIPSSSSLGRVRKSLCKLGARGRHLPCRCRLKTPRTRCTTSTASSSVLMLIWSDQCGTMSCTNHVWTNQAMMCPQTVFV